MVKELDKTQPFATVFGVAGHAYEQNGLYFDQDGNQMAPGGIPMQQAGTAIGEREKTYTKAEVNKMIAESVREAVNATKEPSEAEKEEAAIESGEVPEGPGLVVDSNLDNYTTRPEMLAALAKIKEFYLPDLEYNGRSNKITLMKVLREALKTIENPEG